MSDQSQKGAFVDENNCIGCGLCVSICPKIFEMQDTGKSKAVHPAGDTKENIDNSIAQCPVQAISRKE